MTFIGIWRGAVHAPWLALVTAAALAVPIELPEIGGYAPTLSFLLAPLVAWAVLVSLKDAVSRMFVAAGICGLAVILISAWIKPDDRLHLDLLSLVLLMYTAGFYFLGRHLDLRFTVYFVVFSAVFLVPATLRNILTGQPVLGVIFPEPNSDGYNVLNVEWFGWKMFGNFGILGAAHMICLQAALALGVAISPKRPWIRVAALSVVACSVFLIVGSDSRSSALSLIAIFIGAIICIAKVHMVPRRYIVSALVLVIFVAVTVVAIHGGRLMQTAHDLTSVIIHDAEGSPASGPSLDAISSNRFSLQTVAIDEFLKGPILGSGFSPLGRYAPIPDSVRPMTPHLFYLTVLWKGGLLFSIPFFAFFAMALFAAWQTRAWRQGPMEFMTMIAVITLFSLMALTAETPNVPSAGALAFLLLGALGGFNEVPVYAKGALKSDEFMATT